MREDSAVNPSLDEELSRARKKVEGKVINVREDTKG